MNTNFNRRNRGGPKRRESVLLLLLRSPLRITPRSSPVQHCRNHSWLAQGARFAPCVLGGCATVSQVSQGSGPGMQNHAGRGNGGYKRPLGTPKRPYSRTLLLTHNSARFVRFFLP